MTTNDRVVTVNNEEKSIIMIYWLSYKGFGKNS